MTELSLAAAEDEVERLEIGVENAGAKAARLNDMADEARADKKRLEKQLAAARKAVVAARKRDTQAAAGAAEGRGSV